MESNEYVVKVDRVINQKLSNEDPEKASILNATQIIGSCDAPEQYQSTLEDYVTHVSELEGFRAAHWEKNKEKIEKNSHYRGLSTSGVASVLIGATAAYLSDGAIVDYSLWAGIVGVVGELAFAPFGKMLYTREVLNNFGVMTKQRQKYRTEALQMLDVIAGKSVVATSEEVLPNSDI